MLGTGANIPIAMGFLCYQTKTCGVGGYFYPTGDIEADLNVLRKFYGEKVGKFPANHGEIRFLPKNEKKG